MANSTLDLKMVDLYGQYLNIRGEVHAAIQQVIDQSAFIRGEAIREFSNNLSKFLNIKHVIPCANGTDALQIALMALDLKPGDEVIMPSFTFVSTAEVVKLLNLTPVFVDVDPKTFNINTDQFSEIYTSKSRVILPVHLFGQCANMEPIRSFAKDHRLFIIEDNAQALGARYQLGSGKSKYAGTLGQIGTTSFFPSKILGCFGDGGALFSDDDKIAEQCQMIANHGQRVKYKYERIGINSRLDTIQAAILNVKLKYIRKSIENRQKAAARYKVKLKDLEECHLPYQDPKSEHVWHQFTLKVTNGRRDELQKHLKSKGIPSMVYYPTPLHLQEPYTSCQHSVDLSVSERLPKEVLSLPMHTELTLEAIDYICATIVDFFRHDK